MKIIVTGGAGFIGSALCRYLINETQDQVLNLDALTYAADLTTLAGIEGNPRYQFEKANICDPAALDRLFKTYQPDAVMHLAAESHVDRSIHGPGTFIQTNIVGTYNLLEAARGYFSTLPADRKNTFRFHHISTDEVFGALGPTGTFIETSPYHPNSPYSASKAASDHLVRAWGETYGLPIILSNCSNNYGPYQFPEKLIPVLITRALTDQKLPIYGQGLNVRDWLYVEDHARALHQVLTKGKIGESYNIGGRAERRNIDIARLVCTLLDELCPAPSGRSYQERITFVTDRPGHDFRYAIDCAKIETELGWTPQESFESGLRKTVAWYIDHPDWWKQKIENQPLSKTA